jgi:hypothetical protein
MMMMMIPDAFSCLPVIPDNDNDVDDDVDDGVDDNDDSTSKFITRPATPDSTNGKVSIDDG